MKTPHTSCMRGKRVRIVLRDGTVLRGKFLERTHLHVVLEGFRVRAREIKAFSIARGE